MARFLALGIVLLSLIPLHSYAQRGPQGPIGVIVAPVQKAPFADRIEALGTAKANETVTITADISGKVTKINFEDGQEVKKGAPLLTLDKAGEEASLRAAQAALSERQSSYKRAQSLQQTNALSKATLQERLASLKQGQAEADSIKATIDKLNISAPFDGVLGLRQVSIGTLVRPGDVITTIDDLNRIKVDFDVPSVLLSVLKPGLTIIGKVEAFPDQEFAGEVSTVNTQVDPVTRTVTVRAVLDNADRLLKPGLLMSIVLLKDQREALLIPEEALIKRGTKNFVYVALEEGGKLIAREREIQIGARQPGVLEILGGLNEGDKVVNHGTVKISDGAAIAIRAQENSDTDVGDLLKQDVSQPKKQPAELLIKPEAP